MFEPRTFATASFLLYRLPNFLSIYSVITTAFSMGETEKGRSSSFVPLSVDGVLLISS